LPEQLSLFADRSSGPEGLRYAEEFVSPAAEKMLIGHIAVLPLQRFRWYSLWAKAGMDYNRMASPLYSHSRTYP
jgi:hypothetical protein